MEIALELKEAIAEIAGERSWDETRESWLSRAARRIGVSYSVANRLFYGACRDPKASVVEKIRRARSELCNRQAALTNYELRKDNDDSDKHIIMEIRAAHKALGELLARYNAEMG